jgi:hypothetical protein
MTPERSDIERVAVVEALHTESRYRTWFATILATTIAIVYLGSSFPFYFDQFPALRPVGHIVVSFVLFTLSLSMISAILYAAMYVRRQSSGMTSLRTVSARRMLRDLNRVFVRTLWRWPLAEWGICALLPCGSEIATSSASVGGPCH